MVDPLWSYPVATHMSTLEALGDRRDDLAEDGCVSGLAQRLTVCNVVEKWKSLVIIIVK